MSRPVMLLLSVLIVFADALADDDEDAAKENATEATETATKESEKLRGAEKRAAEDEAIAALVEQHNNGVDSDLDEVVCERVRVTGTRRKVQVCKTKREILMEQESTRRMLMQRNKAGSDPAQATGVGSNN